MNLKVLNLKFPAAVHTAFKIACSHQQTNMQAVVLDMVIRYTKWAEGELSKKGVEGSNLPS